MENENKNKNNKFSNLLDCFVSKGHIILGGSTCGGTKRQQRMRDVSDGMASVTHELDMGHN